MVSFEDIDELLEEDPKKAYEQLKNLNEERNSNDAEVLWRLARACHLVAADIERKSPKKKEKILEGRGYAVAAYSLAPESFLVLKWAAILTGSSTDYVGTKEKIEQGNKFKEFLDKALAMDPKEHSLLHMRGRYAYSVANLSWLERKAAATFFAKPPDATKEEALLDFEAAYALKPLWLENILYLARCYIATDQSTKAVPYLREAVNLEPEDDSEREALEESKSLLHKYGK